MSKLIQGSESINRLALFFNDLRSAQEMLQELGGAEQAKGQFEAAAAGAKLQAEQATAAAEAAKAHLAEIEKAVVEQEQQASLRIGQMTANARMEAEAMITAAKAEIAEAAALADKVNADRVARMDAVVVKYAADVKNLEVVKESLDTAIVAGNAELAALNKRIADAKAAAAAAAKLLTGG